MTRAQREFRYRATGVGARGVHGRGASAHAIWGPGRDVGRGGARGQ